MNENNKKFFIPAAALVCFGVEHAPGALPCDTGLKNNQMCDPYTLNFIEAKNVKVDKKDSNKDNLSLYNRDKVQKTSTTKKVATNKINNDNSTKTIQEESAKKIVTSAKNITLPKIKNEEKIAHNEDKKVKIDTYTYVVHKGDTLEKTAKEFNIDIATLEDLNNLKDEHIVVNQKLKIPKNSLNSKTTKSFYIVKEGDTLKAIAKKFNISLNRLRKYNALTTDTIKTGQKIYLKYTKVAIAKKKSKLKKELKKYQRTKLNSLKVTATAYTSHKGQTDKTPFLAAWNNRLRPGMKVIAVSRDLIKKYGLTNGKKIRIKGLPGTYVVKDKMNKRFKKRIDIYMGLNKKKALKWGKKKIVILF